MHTRRLRATRKNTETAANLVQTHEERKPLWKPMSSITHAHGQAPKSSQDVRCRPAEDVQWQLQPMFHMFWGGGGGGSWKAGGMPSSWPGTGAGRAENARLFPSQWLVKKQFPLKTTLLCPRMNIANPKAES